MRGGDKINKYKINLDNIVNETNITLENDKEDILENLNFLKYCILNRDVVFEESEFEKSGLDSKHKISDWCFKVNELSLT